MTAISPSRRRLLAALPAAALTLALSPAVLRAAEPPVFAVRSGWAIRGYDPVAYFKDGRPVAGHPEISAEWNGATWLFATEENRAAFVAEPARYAPQYGGYCAWAVAHGYTASIDPEAWRVVDGKLYLNYSKAVAAEWVKDIPGYIAKGDANWPNVLK